MNLRARRIVALLAGAALFSAWSCARVPVHRNSYEGTVERVQERDGDHYSPEKGHVPVTGIYLRMARESGAHEQQLLTILVMDIYSPARYGQKGDRVFFQKTGRLPVSGELWFDDLTGYTILPAEK